jgi:EAL domain-containing protein (putative c-di-GMP-specific phosphodiesterase class I)/ActR/RegA family two-component response regulator
MAETLARDSETTGRVLVVDDELAVLRLHERVLRSAGYEVVAATDGLHAQAAVREQRFDVIVSDISMPGLDGLGLLRAVRARDLDVPVILVTGEPTVDAAMKAVEFGALNYLVKPIAGRTLTDVVAHATRLHHIARLKRSALAHLGQGEHQVGDLAGLESAFGRALTGLQMAFQPIVLWPWKRIHGHEALLRSSEPLLPHPGAILDAAERLGRLNDLGRAVRSAVAGSAADLPAGVKCFVNLHPRDLLDEDLYAVGAPLSKLAGRVVLELTERAALDGVGDVQGRVAALRGLGYQIAIDDLGAGYAGLTAFAELKPEVVKIDMSLIRGIHLDEVKQKLVGSIVSVCRDMRLAIVAEGVETIEERDALAGLGAELLQGYLFAKPGRPFPTVTW